MLTGSLQIKRGIYYAVINLYDEKGNRKLKWISTKLKAKGNKRLAEQKLMEIITGLEETTLNNKLRDNTLEKYNNMLLFIL